MKIFSVAAFTLAAIAANVMTANLGMVELPLGVMTTAGTFAAGFVLIARDWVHEAASRLAVLGCIVAGAIFSGIGTPWRIALASAIAFSVSEFLDWAVYSPLRKRGRGRAVIASSAVAAPVDTAIFLWVAGFGVTLPAVVGQTVVKVGFALIAGAVIGAVLRYRKRATRS